MVEHGVDNNARGANVEPDGKCPLGPPPVLGALIAKSEVNHGQSEKRDAGGQNNVRRQDGQIEIANRAGVGGKLAAAAKQVMIQQITAQEDRREAKGRQHRPFVRRDPAPLDQKVASEQHQSGQAVQRRVEMRQYVDEVQTAFSTVDR